MFLDTTNLAILCFLVQQPSHVYLGIINHNPQLLILRIHGYGPNPTPSNIFSITIFSHISYPKPINKLIMIISVMFSLYSECKICLFILNKIIYLIMICMLDFWICCCGIIYLRMLNQKPQTESTGLYWIVYCWGWATARAFCFLI